MNNDKNSKIFCYVNIPTGSKVVQPPHLHHVIFDGKDTEAQQPMVYKSLHLMEEARLLEMESKKNDVDKEAIVRPGQG
ncbi:hypothetical protein EV714DRAFT_222422 [Schizophyllum commune]